MKCIRIHFRAGAMVLAGVLPLLAAGCSQSETPVPRPGMVASRAAPAFGKMLLEPAAMEGSAIRALDYAEEKGSAESAAGLQAAQDAGAAPASALDTLSASLPDRYLIKNARITLEVDDARKAAGQLAAAVQDAGGYVSDMQEAVDALGARQVTMQVRIPAERFGQALEAVEAAGRLLNKQISSQDVTEEYVDTESKLRNLKKTEERLLA